MLFSRAFTALSKLAFCLRISSGGGSLFRILWNSKLFTWSRNDSPAYTKREGECYSLTLLHESREVHLRTYAGDIQIFYDVFWRSIYALPSEHLTKARTVVDLGAHVGMASLFSTRLPTMAKSPLL